MKRLLMIGVLVALFAAACGDDASDTSAPDEAQLPPNPAGACLEGDPDCQDLGPLPTEPPLLPGEPDGGVAPGVGTPMVVDGGLTISEALETDATGPLAVKGFLVEDSNGLRLCEALAESFPPQCGGASIELADKSPIDPDELKTEQGVTWTDYEVTVIGDIVDGVLVPTPFAM